MKNIVIHGADYNSNFGDVLFAHLFYEQYIKDGFNVDILQLKNKRKLCDFVRNELNYYNHISYNEALEKDALVMFSGGMFGQPKNENGNRDLTFLRYETFVKPLLDFQKKGKKTFVIGVGGSTIYYDDLRNKMVEALKNATYVSFRNQETADYFNNLGVTNYEVTTDTANVIENIEPIKLSNKKTILLHIHQSKRHDLTFANNVLPGLKKILKQHEEYDVIVTTCQTVNSMDDFETVKQLSKDFNLIKYQYNNSLELCKVISGCDLVITPALHVGIIGAALGKSVLSFAAFYEKVKRYYRQINEDKRCVNLDKINSVTAFNLLNEYHNKPIKISNELRELARYNLEILNQFNDFS